MQALRVVFSDAYLRSCIRVVQDVEPIRFAIEHFTYRTAAIHIEYSDNHSNLAGRVALFSSQPLIHQSEQRGLSMYHTCQRK